MNGFRYFKHMVNKSNRTLEKELKVSLLLVNFWSSGHEPISANHTETFEKLYQIPFHLFVSDMTPDNKREMDIAILQSLGKVGCEEEIVFNKSIWFDSFTALGYAMFAKNISQKEIAQRMDVSIQTFRSCLKKDKKILKKHLVKISEILHLPESLLEGKLYIETKWEIDSLFMSASERQQFRNKIESFKNKETICY